jgi:tryptophan synthase alpha chain
MPLEESAEVGEALAEEGLALVPLVAPTTPAVRRQRIGEAAEGFVYLVSDVGTTGERARMPSGLADLVGAVKKESGVPVAVGFGISTPAQAAEVGRVADGVIIGSRLVRLVAEAGSATTAADRAGAFLEETRAALGGE